MFRSYRLTQEKFRFGNGASIDRFRGLHQYGPLATLPTEREPIFGFVFPKEYRNLANKLYGALKNGVGYFRGMPSSFRVPLSKSQVFQISDFSISERLSSREEARRYADAVIGWSINKGISPDLFFVLHPKTSDWLDQTPYYECKANLLKEGFLSQHVTTELIENRSQFEWSVANIALQVFAKLGGTPWVLDATTAQRELILGVGSSSLYDPTNRQLRRYIGFTSCFSGNGDFRFLSFTKPARSRDEYLHSLKMVVREALEITSRDNQVPDRFTLHLPKEAGREEYAAVAGAIQEAEGVPEDTRVQIVRVNESSSILAVNPDSADGIPNRGSVVQLGDREYMVYTEGLEERQVWRHRTPTCLRVMPQNSAISVADAEELVAQAFRISQVNWRGFNAGSKPITTLYGGLIARVISHVPANVVQSLYTEKARAVLERRMWFL